MRMWGENLPDVYGQPLAVGVVYGILYDSVAPLRSAPAMVEFNDVVESWSKNQN